MRPLLLLGDSHIRYFQFAAELHLLGERLVTVAPVDGATAVGLRNPKSASQALVAFREALQSAAPDSIVIVQLGEVDCGFVIWYRAQKYGESVEQQMRESIDAYFEFIDDARARGFERIIITGATLPTIRDGQDWGEVADARREVAVALKQRTLLTLSYNLELERGAEARGLPYCDISDELLDFARGEIKEEFRHPDPLDHHLHYERAARCWARRLHGLLD